MARSSLAVVIAVNLLVNAFCLPSNINRLTRGISDNELSNSIRVKRSPDNRSMYTPDPFDDDDDDDFPEPTHTSNGGGSNVMSLLNIASALLSSSTNSNVLIRKIAHDIIDYTARLNMTIHYRDTNQTVSQNRSKRGTPKLSRQRQDIELNSVESSESESSSSSDSEDENEVAQSVENKNESNENNAAEESVENNNEGSSSEQDSSSDGESNESDYDYDEPPGGDGQGGGILGILTGLSGGGDGESDLGTLLAAVSGIVISLSGDGFELNDLITSAVGLFVGLLSEGEENPGAIVASYLITALETITGGGADNNGAFFGKFISRLLKGISAQAGDSEESSEENSDENKMTMTDSFGFFACFFMGLLGDMSKGSSSGSGSK